MPGSWGLRQCWDFIKFKSYADIKTEADRTYVGFIWWVAEPVLYMAIFYFVFAVILQSRTDDFIAFLLIGLTSWRWLQTTIMAGGVSISQSRGVINQVYFPKIMLPIVAVMTNTAKFIVVFLLLIALLWLLGYLPDIAYSALPLLLLAQLMLIAGLSLLLAALTPFLPDVRILLDNALRGIFFMSGIFFDINVIDEPYRSYLYLNPMALIINDYREILIYGRWPDWTSLFVILLISGILLILGILLLNKYDKVYPRIV